MKAIICAIGTLQIYSFGKEWTRCPCGESAARWIDPQKGIMQAAVKHAPDRSAVKLLGLNNQMLGPMMEARGQVWDFNRALHEIATDAPGYIFDKSRAGCWAVIALIGTTTDSSWAADEEHAEAFPPLDGEERLIRAMLRVPPALLIPSELEAVLKPAGITPQRVEPL